MHSEHSDKEQTFEIEIAGRGLSADDYYDYGNDKDNDDDDVNDNNTRSLFIPAEVPSSLVFLTNFFLATINFTCMYVCMEV